MSAFTDQVQADLANMIDDWGDSMKANPTTSKNKTFNGIYQRQYLETENISGYTPTFTCRTKDIDGKLAVDDPVEVTSALMRITKKKFKAVEIENNGLTALVILQERQ